MKSIFCMLLMGFACTSIHAQTAKPDTIWYKYADRFKENRITGIIGYDTLKFQSAGFYIYGPEKSRKYMASLSTADGEFVFSDPGRILYKPSSMNCDFTKTSSQWCFARSKESEHYVVFWENGATGFNADEMLRIGENCWKVYTDQLGFITPGKSSTDKYKIIMRVYNTQDWLASGSGEDRKVGTLNLCPSAATSRGGATVAHEIGHTFQYLTNVDNGANSTHGFDWGLGDNGAGGNGFWEDCANWMAYKVYPERQFTDREYLEGYLERCHLNMMHELARYQNCFYQDYLCDRFGQNFIGRMWRESTRPEDPVDVIMRLQGLDTEGFASVMYDCFAHMCTWDIESVRAAAKHRIGAHPYRLQSKMIDGMEWYQVDPAYCPQNYGYNITQLKLAAAGTTIKLQLQSAVGEEGYRTINKTSAGWKWGIVTLMSDGTTQYGEMQSNEGVLEHTIPEGAEKMWLVVMGAPKKWWHHQWDEDESNDEQWPYRVKMDGTRPTAVPRIYTDEDFPEDYVRKDTTVTYDCYLSYSSNEYLSVRVQYDMDAISEALGLTTAQLKAIKTGSSSYNPRFVGVSRSGTISYVTTTTSSNSTRYGHWFNASGAVCNYDNNAVIFAEMYPESFGCYVGQYPGRLTKGKIYTIRQAVQYRVGTKTYKATMLVNVNVI